MRLLTLVGLFLGLLHTLGLIHNFVSFLRNFTA
jgi:hypothetical protein